MKKIKVCRSTILPVDLCGCESWSVALSEGHRRKVFENRVLRKIFEPDRDDVTGNEEGYIKRSSKIRSLLLTKNYLAGQVKKNEMGGACGTYGRRGRCMQGFGGET
jgi:hypothetical protein